MFQVNKEKRGRSQHVCGWTWKHKDFDRLCPKGFSDTLMVCISQYGMR